MAGFDSTLSPSAYGTRRDVAYSDDLRRQKLLDELLAQEQLKTRMADPLEKAKMEASARNFETRTGVQELPSSGIRPPTRTAPMPSPLDLLEDDPPMSEGGALVGRGTPPLRTIRRGSTITGPAVRTDGRADVTTAFGTSPQTRTIRRFGSNTTPTDPDAAMGAEARANLAPGVMAAKIGAQGRIDEARIGAQQRTDEARTKAEGTTPDGPSPYSEERGRRIVSSIDELLPQINNWTAGWGSKLAGVPGSAALHVKSQLKTLTSNIAFNELTAMREASKTGGALGQISDKENELLANALGALELAQDPADVKVQLQKVRDSVTRWHDAQARARTPTGGSPADSSDPLGIR